MASAAMALRGAALLLLLASGSHAFLATPLNASDPDVVNILCPDQVSGRASRGNHVREPFHRGRFLVSISARIVIAEKNRCWYRVEGHVMIRRDWSVMIKYS